MKKFSVVLMLLILWMVGLGALQVSAADESLSAGQELFFNARKLISAGNITEAKGPLASSKKHFEGVADRAEKYYWLARVEYWYGQIAVVEQNKKVAEKKFVQSQELANKSLEYKESSDTYRLLADTYMQLMNYKNFFYQMANGSKLKSLPEKALQLDSNNKSAQISLAIFYLNSPKFSGGSVEKAIELLRVAHESEDAVEQFYANVWLGVAYEKNNDKKNAIKYFEQGLEIFPNNKWAQESSAAVR